MRRSFDVTHYDARIVPNVSDRTLNGVVRIDLAMTVKNESVVELDCGDLMIDTVKDAGASLDFDVRDHRLTIRWPRPARVNEVRHLEITYHGAPRFGMQFYPDQQQVYTVFATSQWLVCVDAPDDKATLTLTVVLPASLVVVANGLPIRQRALPGGMVAHEWRQNRPMPSYTFGFAAGRFTDVTEHRDGHRLRYLGASLSSSQLRQIFRDSAAMMRFFEDRAGVRYDTTYTQALVTKTVGQEMSGFSLLSEDYGRAVLAEPRAASLLAHELAHQWWGNSITCAAWTHMWLNEGVATFMAAAFMEQRFGRDEYLRAVENWQSRSAAVRDAGHDRSLVFPDWDHPTADDRTLVYQKGAYVLHLLREILGESLFWSGLRDYTRRYAGLTVTTSDFQQAMERSTHQDLAAFFRTWVYLDETP
jgi:aminopeptidase N